MVHPAFTIMLGKSTIGRCSSNWATCFEAIKGNSYGDRDGTGLVTICLPIMRTRPALSSNTLRISSGLRTKKLINGGIGPMCRNGIISGDRFLQQISERIEGGWPLSLTTDFDSSRHN